MTDPFSVVARNKLLCCGVELEYHKPPDLNPKRPTVADFDALVTEYYTLFRENMRGDVAFLLSIERKREVVEFDNAVYLLRTAKQHTDNPKATAFYDSWTGTRTFQTAAEALAVCFTNALLQLVVVSNLVRRDSELTEAWKSRASIEPASIFEAVCDDLKVRFSVANKKRLIRNVTNRVQRLRADVDTRVATEGFCVEEIVAQSISLPVPYVEILDRLGLIGASNASAALLMAYSVQASTNLTGDEFLLRVEETWKVATSRFGAVHDRADVVRQTVRPSR
ncbi:hypothetical protein FEZ60_26320 [Rhodococcus sp. MS16]|uniref:hypothetical protein n=1 Tax=Rhodococcus sp. MS16 TaxID=2579941 RepID=UPI0015629432|nr:hypothetical protein [Rhodococcus sp. MS16]NRI69042.1 hypothetical protein [Rhodococcus sp. MS16]